MAKRTRQRRTWKLLIGVTVGVIVAVWGLHAWALARSETAIRVEIAKLKSIGIDVDAATLPITEREQALWDELKVLARESETFGRRPKESRRYQPGALDRGLKRYAEQSSSLYVAVERKSHERMRFREWEGVGSRYVFSPESTPTDRFTMSSVATLSQLGELGKARADYYAPRDWDRSLEALATSIRLSRMGTGTMPLIKEEEVWVQLLRLRRVAALDSVQLEKTLAWMEASSPMPDLSFIFAADIAAMLHVYRIASYDFEGFNLSDIRSLPDQVSMAWRMTTLRKNWSALRYLRTRYEGLRERSGDVYADYLATGTRSYGAGAFLVKLDTHARMTYVVYWLALQRLRTGSLPGQLPSEPMFLDGFTGKPFHYVVKGDTYVIRSFGPNQKDDLGGGDDFQVTESEP